MDREFFKAKRNFSMVLRSKPLKWVLKHNAINSYSTYLNFKLIEILIWSLREFRIPCKQVKGIEYTEENVPKIGTLVVS